MSKVLPSNRIAALSAFIAGLAGCGTSLAGVWPSSVTTEIALIAGGVATIAGPLAHIVGSILWQATPTGQAIEAQRALPQPQQTFADLTPGPDSAPTFVEPSAPEAPQKSTSQRAGKSARASRNA